jgi:hypothetical protein
MKQADGNSVSCPAGASTATDSTSACVQQSGAAGAAGAAGDRGEAMHAGWETAWIDIGGEG